MHRILCRVNASGRLVTVAIDAESGKRVILLLWIVEQRMFVKGFGYNNNHEWTRFGANSKNCWQNSQVVNEFHVTEWQMESD